MAIIDLTPLQFAAAELIVRREIDMHFLPRPAALVLDVIVECSFGWRRTTAYIPRLDYFVETIRRKGMNRPHVSEAIKWLASRRIITESGGCYAVNPLFLEWRAQRRSPAAAEQLTLLEPPAELHDELLKNFVEHAPVRAWANEMSIGNRGASAVPASSDGTAGSRDQRETVPMYTAPDSEGWGSEKRMESARSKSSETERTPEVNPPGFCSPESARAGVAPQIESEKFGTGVVPNFGTAGGASAAGPAEKVPNFGTPPGGASAKKVPNFGTLAENPNKTGHENEFRKTELPGGSRPAAFPPSYSPPSGSINEESISTEYPNNRLTRGSTRGAKSVPNFGTRQAREEEWLMGLIGDFVGPDEMKSAGGMWRSVVVRNVASHVIEEAVANGRYRASTGYQFRNRAAWLMGDIAKLAGLKSIGELKARPRMV